MKNMTFNSIAQREDRAASAARIGRETLGATDLPSRFLYAGSERLLVVVCGVALARNL